MRLWHYKLIPILDDKRLIKQHCECCAFRKNLYQKGNYPGCSKDTDISEIVWYHLKILKEMDNRGFRYDKNWHIWLWRGKNMANFLEVKNAESVKCHDSQYLEACIERLKIKGYELTALNF